VRQLRLDLHLLPLVVLTTPGYFSVFVNFDHNVGADRFSHPSRYTTEYHDKDRGVMI
jgi:hypothetical protein